MTKSMYDIIKRQNGEAFAQAIRRFDSGIFEIEKLPEIVKFAGRDATEILPYLASLKPKYEAESQSFLEAGDLFLLAQQAGYKVIYANTLEKQNSILPFFEPAEELCTFRDEKRFKKYYILHMIREDAERLNRADFKGIEARDDAYGTSVISIQVAKEGGYIKICNRYNHSVQNPDNTFDGNPDNIISGMTAAIEKFLGRKVGANAVPLPDNYIQLDDKIYRYHLEEDNIYYGDGFYIKDHKFHSIDKDYQLIVDSFMIDFKRNEIRTLHGLDVPESDIVFFHTTYNHIPLIKEEIRGGKLTRRKNKGEDEVYVNGHLFLKARNGVLTFLHLKKPQKSAVSIFKFHNGIEELYLDNLRTIGEKNEDQSFFSCPKLRVLSLPKLAFLKSSTIVHLPKLETLCLKNVLGVLNGCLNYLGELKTLDLPVCREIFKFSLSKNKNLRTINIPHVRKIGSHCIVTNPSLEHIFVDVNCLESVDATALKESPNLILNEHKCIKKSNLITSVSKKRKDHFYE